MEFSFDAPVVKWQGPSPWFFALVPEDESDAIRDHSGELTYGWGAIPVSVTIGKTGFATSLFPKDGQYYLPLKAAVRKAEGIEEGGTVSVRLLAE
jgi:hypothetical protein